VLRALPWRLGILLASSGLGCGVDTSGLLDTPDGDSKTVGVEAGAAPDGSAAHPVPPQADAASLPIVSLPIVWDGGAIAPSSASTTTWVDFCVALVGCGHVPTISECLSHRPQPTTTDAVFPPQTMFACVVNAGSDCTAVASCLGDGAQCDPPSYVATCQANDRVTECPWGFVAVVDCAQLGMVCSKGAGNAGCGFGDCAPSQLGQSYCLGDYVVTCNGARYVPSLDCQSFKSTCVGAAGSSHCHGQGAACASGPACKGASIDICMDGKIGSADCAALYGSGFTCSEDDAGIPVCSAIGTKGLGACDPPTNADTCANANKVTFCNAGTLATYSCDSQGWANGCDGGQCTN
jgi:hypothetical protein